MSRKLWGRLGLLALGSLCLLVLYSARTNDRYGLMLAPAPPVAPPARQSEAREVASTRTRSPNAALFTQLLWLARERPRGDDPRMPKEQVREPLVPEPRADADLPPPEPSSADGGSAPPSREVQRRWENEVEDAALSAQLSRQVTSTLDDLQIDGSLLHASCRTTVCKLELRFAGIEQAAELREGTGDGDMALAIDLKPDEAGLTAEVYLPRARAEP